MRYILIYSLLLLFFNQSKGQNLIIDPGFEEVTFEFDGKDTVYVYTHWQSLLSYKKLSPWGLPKYSKYLRLTETDRFLQYNIPYEGDSHFRSHFPYRRNLYQTKLIEKLNVGNKYKVELMYKVLADYHSKEKVQNAINGKIGVSLSMRDLSFEEQIAKYDDQINYHFKPQFAIYGYDADNNFQWLKFETIFEADYPFEYLTVGNFIRLVEPIDCAPGQFIKGVSFNIDNVRIYEVADSSQISVIDSSLYVLEKEATNTKTLNFDRETEPFLMQYYSFIYLAEKQIIQGNIDSSLHYYTEAFKHKSPNFREYRNASKAIALSKIASGKELNTQIEYNRDPKKDELTAMKIDSIFNLDQQVRHKNKGIGAQDSSNYWFLNDLIRSKTISEETIGFNNMQHLNIMLLHLSRYANFDSTLHILYEEVLKGNFDNRQFASLVDSYYINNLSVDRTESYYFSASAYPLFTQFVIPVLDPDLIEEINIRRHRIGLESLEDQYRKQFYNFKYGYRDFEFYQFFSYFPAEEFCTEEEKAKYLEKEKDKVAELRQQYAHLIIWSK